MPQYALLHKALRFAAKAHRDQDRDEAFPLPYITHPMEVVTLLRYTGGVTEEAILCAAALHDVVEESETTPEQIREKFGERVADLVREVTRTEPTKTERDGLTDAEIWSLRSQMLLDEIAAMSPAAQSIKLADRVSNLGCALITRTGERLDRYVRQSREILRIVPREVNPNLWDRIQALVDPTRQA